MKCQRQKTGVGYEKPLWIRYCCFTVIDDSNQAVPEDVESTHFMSICVFP